MQVNKEKQQNVESDSEMIESIVIEISKKYTKDLDDYVDKIKTVLETDADGLSMDDLSRILVRVISYSYFLTEKQELVGIKYDIATMLRTEKYNDAYMSLQNGTIARKTVEAESKVKEEDTIALIYNHVYKMLKNKYDTCNRLSDAIKKVMNIRVAQMQLGLKE